MEKELAFLGLSENEIKIYLYLLRNPSANGSNIRRGTSIANSRVYSSLDNLIEMGLVSFETLPKGRVFSAVDPDVISEIFNAHMKKVQKIIPELKNMKNEKDNPTLCSIYQGFHGFRNALLRMAHECPKGQTVYIIGFSNQAYKNEKLRHLLYDANKISVKKKHRFKMILDSKENVFFKDRKIEGISELRFMNKGFVSPAAIDIFDDTVYFFLWAEEPYAFMIKNKNLALGFKSYFNFLWNISTK